MSNMTVLTTSAFLIDDKLIGSGKGLKLKVGHANYQIGKWKSLHFTRKMATTLLTPHTKKLGTL